MITNYKIFEDLDSRHFTQRTIDWLNSVAGKGNWKINGNKIDVNGKVNFQDDKRIVNIPVQFGVIQGDFDIARCDNLESLKGCPDIVLGHFLAQGCKKITSLEYGPQTVKGGYLLTGCSNLINLEGCPEEIFEIFSVNSCSTLKN